MTKLTRLVAISILMISLSGVALADGGDTLTPPVPPPPAAQCAMDCSEPEASEPVQPAQDWSVDIVTAAEFVAYWLAASIF